MRRDLTAFLISQRLGRVVLALLLVLLVGSAGYRFLFGWSWLEAIYFTAITVSTVGYGEPRELGEAERIFTLVLLAGGMGIVAYCVAQLGAMLLEIEPRRLLHKHFMRRFLRRMRDHYIICGYGRTGMHAVEALRLSGTPLVIIDNSTEVIETAKQTLNLRQLKHEEHATPSQTPSSRPPSSDGTPLYFVHGDATQDDVLAEAQTSKAKGLVAALGKDPANLYVVLSARALNPKLNIVAWASSAEAEGKMIQAGATETASPYRLAGTRLAHLLHSPNAVALLSDLLRVDPSYALHELVIAPGGPLAGKTLEALALDDLQLIVLGIRRADGRSSLNARPDSSLHGGDRLICMGTRQSIAALKQRLGSTLSKAAAGGT